MVARDMRRPVSARTSALSPRPLHPPPRPKTEPKPGHPPARRLAPTARARTVSRASGRPPAAAAPRRLMVRRAASSAAPSRGASEQRGASEGERVRAATARGQCAASSADRRPQPSAPPPPAPPPASPPPPSSRRRRACLTKVRSDTANFRGHGSGNTVGPEARPRQGTASTSGLGGLGPESVPSVATHLHPGPISSTRSMNLKRRGAGGRGRIVCVCGGEKGLRPPPPHTTYPSHDVAVRKASPLPTRKASPPTRTLPPPSPSP